MFAFKRWLTPIHIQYERFLSGIGGGDDAIAIGYLSGNRCHVARDDTIAISASNVVGQNFINYQSLLKIRLLQCCTITVGRNILSIVL